MTLKTIWAETKRIKKQLAAYGICHTRFERKKERKRERKKATGFEVNWMEVLKSNLCIAQGSSRLFVTFSTLNL